VADLILTVLLVSLCYFVYLGGMIFCLCLRVYASVYNGSIPFRLPLVETLCVSFPGGRRDVFLFRGLVGNFSSYCNVFHSLDAKQLD